MEDGTDFAPEGAGNGERGTGTAWGDQRSSRSDGRGGEVGTASRFPLPARQNSICWIFRCASLSGSSVATRHTAATRPSGRASAVAGMPVPPK